MLYVAASGCIAAGFADFPLLAYHFQKVGTVKPEWIPILYALAMATDAFAALLFGYLYDRKGMGILLVGALLPVPVAPLVFFGGFDAALAAAVLWGIGMGAQESIMKATVAAMSPKALQATAFGTFDLSFGILWFPGSALMGWLYNISVPVLVAFSVMIQLLSIPLLALSVHSTGHEQGARG